MEAMEKNKAGRLTSPSRRTNNNKQQQIDYNAHAEDIKEQKPTKELLKHKTIATHYAQVKVALVISHLERLFRKTHQKVSKNLSEITSELGGWSREAFWKAFDKIGVRHYSQSQFNKAVAQNKMFIGDDGKERLYCSVRNRKTHQTTYYRNNRLADLLLHPDTAQEALMTLNIDSKIIPLLHQLISDNEPTVSNEHPLTVSSKDPLTEENPLTVKSEHAVSSENPLTVSRKDPLTVKSEHAVSSENQLTVSRFSPLALTYGGIFNNTNNTNSIKVTYVLVVSNVAKDLFNNGGTKEKDVVKGNLEEDVSGTSSKPLSLSKSSTSLNFDCKFQRNLQSMPEKTQVFSGIYSAHEKKENEASDGLKESTDSSSDSLPIPDREAPSVSTVSDALGDASVSAPDDNKATQSEKPVENASEALITHERMKDDPNHESDGNRAPESLKSASNSVLDKQANLNFAETSAPSASSALSTDNETHSSGCNNDGDVKSVKASALAPEALAQKISAPEAPSSCDANAESLFPPDVLPVPASSAKHQQEKSSAKTTKTTTKTTKVAKKKESKETEEETQFRQEYFVFATRAIDWIVKNGGAREDAATYYKWARKLHKQDPRITVQTFKDCFNEYVRHRNGTYWKSNIKTFKQFVGCFHEIYQHLNNKSQEQKKVEHILKQFINKNYETSTASAEPFDGSIQAKVEIINESKPSKPSTIAPAASEDKKASQDQPVCASSSELKAPAPDASPSPVATPREEKKSISITVYQSKYPIDVQIGDKRIQYDYAVFIASCPMHPEARTYLHEYMQKIEEAKMQEQQQREKYFKYVTDIKIGREHIVAAIMDNKQEGEYYKSCLMKLNDYLSNDLEKLKSQVNLYLNKLSSYKETIESLIYKLQNYKQNDGGTQNGRKKLFDGFIEKYKEDSQFTRIGIKPSSISLPKYRGRELTAEQRDSFIKEYELEVQRATRELEKLSRLLSIISGK